jgi:pimeloyl-ACP methyl ester carboxylesterase
VVVFDHLGFGFSDKPVDYTYSLVDQAEQAIQLWMELGIEYVTLIFMKIMPQFFSGALT